MSTTSKDFVLNVLREMFNDVVSVSLSESAAETIIFVLRSRLGGDPFEVLWERPRAVYEELKRVFGDGTDVLIGLWVKAFKRRAETDVDPEKFLQLLQQGSSESVKEIRQMLRELATAYHKASRKGEGR
ncbi:MAG: hypothetical protein QXZ51_03980 [Candidatus Bathyarchaeia archaeon]